MRSVLTSGGIQTFVSLYEKELLDKYEGKEMPKTELSEREQEIAKILTHRGVLSREENEDGIYYIRDVNNFGEKGDAGT